MISYEYESQPLVISIRDELEQLGFNVWMTSENDENSLEDIMTHGVEEAAVVIVAVTRKYKQEPYTFSGKIKKLSVSTRTKNVLVFPNVFKRLIFIYLDSSCWLIYSCIEIHIRVLFVLLIWILDPF